MTMNCPTPHFTIAFKFPCFAISVITDMGIPDLLKEAKIEHIIEAASKAEPGMTTIIKELIKQQ